MGDVAIWLVNVSGEDGSNVCCWFVDEYEDELDVVDEDVVPELNVATVVATGLLTWLLSRM